MLSTLDKEIIKLLKKAPLSTYQITKELKVSWSTVNSHCYKLKSMNILDSKIEESKFGLKPKVIWWVKNDR